MAHAPTAHATALAKDAGETRIALRLLSGMVLALVAAIAAVFTWGLAALTVIALAATVVVFAILTAYAAGL